MEGRRDKFKRLATQRVNNALKQIELIGNLGNKSNYDYTEEDIRKIFSELDKALRETRSKFNRRKTREFKL